MALINENLPIPLVLHGGSGIPEDKIANQTYAALQTL